MSGNLVIVTGLSPVAENGDLTWRGAELVTPTVGSRGFLFVLPLYASISTTG